MPTLGVYTYQSEYHLGRCQHPGSILDVNTYLKENAEWQPVEISIFEQALIPWLIKGVQDQYLQLYRMHEATMNINCVNDSKTLFSKQSSTQYCLVVKSIEYNLLYVGRTMVPIALLTPCCIPCELQPIAVDICLWWQMDYPAPWPSKQTQTHKRLA